MCKECWVTSIWCQFMAASSLKLSASSRTLGYHIEPHLSLMRSARCFWWQNHEKENDSNCKMQSFADVNATAQSVGRMQHHGMQMLCIWEVGPIGLDCKINSIT